MIKIINGTIDEFSSLIYYVLLVIVCWVSVFFVRSVRKNCCNSKCSKECKFLLVNITDCLCYTQTMPVELFCMCHLSVLLMRNNPLKEIPSDIGKLQHLHTAVFSFCQLTTLPAAYEIFLFLLRISKALLTCNINIAILSICHANKFLLFQYCIEMANISSYFLQYVVGQSVLNIFVKFRQVHWIQVGYINSRFSTKYVE